MEDWGLSPWWTDRCMGHPCRSCSYVTTLRYLPCLQDDVESLGVYNRSEQVSLASGISDALTVAGGVPAALSAEESITTVMAVVGRDGTVASVSEPGGMVEAIGQGDQPPDLSIH